MTVTAIKHQNNLFQTAYCLSSNSGLVSTNKLLELEVGHNLVDDILEVVLGRLTKLRGVRLMFLDVESNSGAGRTSSRQSDNKSSAVGELDVQTLVGRDRAVEIGVFKVTGLGNLKRANLGTDKRVELVVQTCNHLGSAFARHVLIVVSGKEGSSVSLPEVLLDGGDGSLLGVLLSDASDDVEPSDDCPETVLLSDVVGAGSKDSSPQMDSLSESNRAQKNFQPVGTS